jgi:nifR3 family TIM-barrel protein
MKRKADKGPISLNSCTIFPPIALAPMVGLSHSALRLLIVELGGAGLFFSEMLSVGKLPTENEKISPFLTRTPAEKPLFYQIFTGPGQDVVPAVERLHTLNAQGIDLNLGCPAPALRKLGAGSFMDDSIIVETIRKIRSATPLPLSAKIRLGKSLNEKTLVSFCEMLENEGVDLLTVHGRLHGEKFCRKVRWDWIGKAKKAVTIPVIANGGIFTIADAEKCLLESEADGLMIGRGAAVRPWIFGDIARELYGIEIAERPSLAKIYFRFIELLENRFQPERRLGRLKQFTHYYAENFAFGHHLASGVQNANSIEEAGERAEKFFEKSTEK